MWKRLKKALSIITANNYQTESSKKSDLLIKGVVAILLAGASIILSVINIITKNWFMMASTLVLTFGFGFSALLLLLLKKAKIAEAIIELIIVVVFTYYALWGQNDGFAVLWIILCPAISTLFFSFKRGLGLSIYFFALVLFVFYGPKIFPQLLNIIPAYKNETIGYYEQFTIRYPALYLSSFVTSVFLNAQKIYYFKMAEEAAISDNMTSLRNRRYFDDFTNSIGFNSKVDHNFTILSIDLNNLKSINDNLGHVEGDFAIRKTAEILHTVFDKYTKDIYRTGGDEFFVFFQDDNNDVDSLIEQVHKLASQVNIGKNPLSLSVGSVKGRDYINSTFAELLTIVDAEMYKNKQKYYNEHPEQFRRTYHIK